MQHRALAHTLRTTSDEKRRENGAEASRQRPELAVDQRDPIHEEWGNVTAPKHDISLSITIAAPPCTVGQNTKRESGRKVQIENVRAAKITVQHPAAKSMIEISRTQDEEVGDGTTSVIILAGELLSAALPFLDQNMHPTVIISAYRQALEDIITILKEKVSTPVDVNNPQQMTEIIKSCIGTKFINKWYAITPSH
ncbi:hypothetical protein HPB51_002794 [Rhipicephalus microplus]|uniref:T-complex protein 1 subunit delta n=7 Tax=Chelicerata TaxID=6843 RepID=A0A9J6EWC2_RHIMP|nr:hypothetical protein HPB51_002794 [Rhipicephalus microplus]